MEKILAEILKTVKKFFIKNLNAKKFSHSSNLPQKNFPPR